MFCVSFASGRSRSSRSRRSVRRPSSSPTYERAPAADEDAARIEVVGAEVDERADRPLLADDRGDQRLVDTVLKRDDEPVGREPGRDLVQCRLGVLRLHGEQHRAELCRQLARHHRARLHGELVDGPFEREAARVDRCDVVGVGVAEEDGVAGADQPRTDRASDRARADDHVVDRIAHSATAPLCACAKVATISCSARSRMARLAASAAAGSPFRTASWSAACCTSETAP